MVTKEMRKALNISKVKDSRFRFNRIYVNKFEYGIEISMNYYTVILEDMEIRENKSD